MTTTGAGSQFVFNQIYATFAKDKDLIGQQDPYIVFELGKARGQSSVKKSGGVNPTWENEDIVLDGDTEGDQTLNIAIYNKNTLLPDGMLGHATVAVNQLNGTQRLTLFDKKGGNETGTLTFNVRGGSGGLNQQSTGQQAGFTTLGAEGYGAGTTSGTATTGAATATGGAREVCDRQTFSTVEDRPVVRERKEYILEHNPVEKEFVVETKFAGEHAIGGGATEHIGTEVNVVSEAPRTSPCDGAQDIGAQRVAGATGTTGTTTGY
jgi:hypothetical protein